MRAKEKLPEPEVIDILPSFLLKSLQFISLLCQGRLQVQVASIVGQLQGTVIRLRDTVKQRPRVSPLNMVTMLNIEQMLLLLCSDQKPHK